MSEMQQVSKLEALLARVLERRNQPRVATTLAYAGPQAEHASAAATDDVAQAAAPSVEAVSAKPSSAEAVSQAAAPSAAVASASAAGVEAEEIEAELIESSDEPPAVTLASTEQRLAEVVPLPSRTAEPATAPPPPVPQPEVSHARLSARPGYETQHSMPAMDDAEAAKLIAPAAAAKAEAPVSSARSVDPSVEDESAQAVEAPPKSAPQAASRREPAVASTPQQVSAAAPSDSAVAFAGELPLPQRSVRRALARALLL